MRQIKCPACGGHFVPQQEGYYICDHCGTISEGFGAELSEQDVIDLDNANYRRNVYDFDEALSLCSRVLSHNPLNAEANRGALLARYKIVYLKNGSGEYKPTFLDPETDSPIHRSPYYRNLPESLKREFDKIEESRQRVLRNAKGIPQYDVFLSYKSGTEEAAWAKECYHMLSRQKGGKRYSTFYDETSLGSKQAGWEPHIYSALKSARCLVLFASSLNNLNSPWVQNEWKRFIWFQKTDPQKQIIVVGKNINAYKLPDALREGQMLSGENNAWMGAVMSRIREVCDDANLDELLKNADSYILNGKFKKAKTIYSRVLSHDPNNAAAYWGLLRCRLKAFDDYDIVKRRGNLEKYDEFYKARTLAETGEDKLLRDKIRTIQNAQIARNASAFPRENYENYRKKTKGRRGFKRFVAVFSVLAVLALGGFGYWESSHPLKYDVNSMQVTLAGKSIFYDWFGPEELTLDRYDGYPIIAVGEGALQGASLRQLKLGSTVRTVGDAAFEGCSSLETATILASDITIGKNAFAGCGALRSITFGATSEEGTAALAAASPSDKISVGDGAFENCVSLEEIELKGLSSLGAGAFRGCSSLKKVLIDSKLGLTIGAGAFDGTPDTLVVEIPTVEEELLLSLSREYPELTFEGYTRDRAEEVRYFIDKIGEVTIESGAAIDRAEELYEALTAAERTSVTNYEKLRDARAVYTAVEVIGGIGSVTLESGSAIEAAESAYNGLNAAQKELVGNYSALSNARAVYDVMKSISAIGQVTLQSKGAIDRAETAYVALTEEQKGMVSNYATLQEARDKYEVLSVTQLITRIGVVGEESGPAIEQAERAYNALSASLRAQVSNSNVLRDARSIYNVIVAIAPLAVILPDSSEELANAQTLYGALTPEQQEKVTNYDLLEDAPTIYNVVSSIVRIGTVGLSSGQNIARAEAAFAALDETRQTRVGNASDLTDARAAYDVMVMIDALGTASAEGRGAVEAAKEAYDGLTPAQRKKVANADSLQEAVDALRVLDAEDLIRDIGQVTLQSNEKIQAAEAAYGALTDAQQKRVSNHSTLTDARHIYDLLVVIDGMGSVVVGTGTQYSYATLTASSTSQLNDRSFRNSIDSITFTGLKNIGELVWRNAFPGLELVRYDLTGDAPSSYRVPNGVLTYVLVGSTGKKYTTTITAQAGSAVHVGFDNFALESGTLPIDLSDAASSSIYFSGNCSVTAAGNGVGAIVAKECTINLSYNANVTITAGNGTTGSAGGTGISATYLDIVSSGTVQLTIKGGNGGDAKEGQEGASGGCGVKVSGTVIVNTKGELNIFGGNGGKGGKGADSSDKSTEGKTGSKGGDGNYAIECKNFDNFCETLCLTGGNGGEGGVGGKGCDGKTGWGKENYYVATRGGKGGNGGNGGGALKCDVSVYFAGKSITVKTGNGGNGGTGGHGGNGGIVDNKGTWIVVDTYWKGTPARGGDGGDGGNKGANSATIENPASASLVSGNPGQGGAGGEGGDPWKILNWAGTAGIADADKNKKADSGSAGKAGT